MACVVLLLLHIAYCATGDSGFMDGIDVRLVVPSGDEATLPCPIRPDPSTVHFSWSRGDAPLPEGPRVRVLPSGALQIQETTPDDQGEYVCQAESPGFESRVVVTLIVLDGGIPVTEESLNATLPDSNMGASPVFSDRKQQLVTIVNRSTGRSVKFQCQAKGKPRPQVVWYKNGKPYRNRTLGKIRRWTLLLKNLTATDSGNYTCHVANIHGSVNATFFLRVSGNDRPDLALFHPLNTTVKYGSSATFQCRVRSEAPPNIQWLKRIEDEDPKEEGEVMRVQGENYRVLKTSQVHEKQDGSFLNKLLIPQAREKDSGKYICLGANSMGYSFRSAFLNVLPRPKPVALGWSRSVSIHPGHPSSLLVAIPVTLGVVVGVLVALVVLCHRRRLDTPISVRPSYRKADQSVPLESAVNWCNEEDKDRDVDVDESMALSVTKDGQVVSEVEVKGKSVVTKLCQQDNSDCFVLRDEV